LVCEDPRKKDVINPKKSKRYILLIYAVKINEIKYSG
jgi:hypothetical protein